LAWEPIVLTSENNPTESQRNEFARIQTEMFDLFFFAEQNRVYFPESVYELVDKILSGIRGNVLAAGIFGRIERPSENTMQQSYDAFTKGYEEFEKDIPAALRGLEAEFRKMLGADEAGKHVS